MRCFRKTLGLSLGLKIANGQCRVGEIAFAPIARGKRDRRDPRRQGAHLGAGDGAENFDLGTGRLQQLGLPGRAGCATASSTRLPARLKKTGRLARSCIGRGSLSSLTHPSNNLTRHYSAARRQGLNRP